MQRTEIKMIGILTLGSSAACFELKNEAVYYADQTFGIWLNDVFVRDEKRNVFSLFSLQPGTAYCLRLIFADGKEETLDFYTQEEQCALSVRAFGACGDGQTDDTQAIRTAIACLPEGGRLIFPKGEYLTSPLFLKSNMTLELQDGAHLIGSPDRSDYPVIPPTVKDETNGKEIFFGGFEGNEMPMYQAMIQASYAENIRIIGPGVIDGNAQNSDWWEVFHQLDTARPRLLFFNRCNNVTVHGVQACNSASWQLHPYYSENVGFYDIAVSAPKNSPNTDALDPEGCNGVEIIGCRFSVGDDCIAIKSGKMELARKLKAGARRHTIRNCLMEFGHGAITLGSEIGAGVYDLKVSQCLFRGTDRGLRIKTRRGRGEDCRVTDVAFDNIIMDGVMTPVVINMWYNCCDPDRESEYVWSREKLPVDDRTPHFGTFRFSNMTCTDAHAAACYIDGLPESPIEKVSFENVSISFAENARPGIPAMENFAQERCRLGFYLDNVREISISKVQLMGTDGEKVIASHYETLNVDRLE